MDTSSEVRRSIPKTWQWIEDIFDEAHLPNLGLPAKWEQTEGGHALIAYDPKSKMSFNIETGKRKHHKKSPVGFIMSTTNQNPMPGTNAPASVRYERYMEAELQDSIFKDRHGDVLAPCIAHGDYVKVQSLQSDHMHAKENILKRQQELVNRLNQDRNFARYVMSLDGMDKFFVRAKLSDDMPEQYYGTLFFYELYFNDIDNIWLICQACNAEKSNKETATWLYDQWLYGRKFADYLKKLERRGTDADRQIIQKTKNKEGLAEVAIQWFWKKHAGYISYTKEFLQEVKEPFQLLNETIDHVINSGRFYEAERLEASLEIKLLAMEAISQSSQITLPAIEKEIRPVLEQEHLTELPPGVYRESGKEAVEEMTGDLSGTIASKTVTKIKKHKTQHPGKEEADSTQPHTSHKKA